MNEPRRKYTKRRKSIRFDDIEGLGKMPPQNIEIEKTVLGTILIDKEIIHQVIDKFTPELFFNNDHQTIANCIINLYKEAKSIDLMTVFSELKKMGASVPVAYLTELVSPIASTMNFDEHFKVLQEDALKRALILISYDIGRSCYDETVDVFDTYAKVQADLINVFKNIVTTKAERAGNIHLKIIEETETHIKDGTKSGVESGLKAMDAVTNGWQKTDLIILAARPSMGKTATVVCAAMHAAIEKKEPVGIFSLEMSKEQIVSRMQSLLTHIDVGKIVRKQLDAADLKHIVEFAAPIIDAPIYIDDTPAISIFEFRAKARRLVQEQGVKLIIVDYLQLMTSGVRTGNREQEIATISRGIKQVAKELNIPVIALSQLSRTVESRADKKPQLSDLRESGQIEQDADMVIFCYRPEYYDIETYEIDGRELDAHELIMFIIAKHRNGSLGEVPARFIGKLAKVTNLENNAPAVAHLDNSGTFVQQGSETPRSGRSALDRVNYDQPANNRDDLPF